MTCATFALRVVSLVEQAGHQCQIVPLHIRIHGAIRLVQGEEWIIIDSSARRGFILRTTKNFRTERRLLGAEREPTLPHPHYHPDTRCQHSDSYRTSGSTLGNIHLEALRVLLILSRRQTISYQFCNRTARQWTTYQGATGIIYT